MLEEKAILNRLEWLSAIEPDEQAVNMAMNEIQQRLTGVGIIGPTLKARTFTLITRNKITKFAAAAIFMIFVAMPLTYAVSKLINYLLIEKTERVLTYGDKKYIDEQTVAIIEDTDTEKTEIRVEEAIKLIKEGKAERIEPGLYRVKISDGTTIEVPYKTKADLKAKFDEVEELRKAGQYERIYKPEHDYFDENGIKHKFYTDHFLLSNGEAVVVGGYE